MESISPPDCSTLGNMKEFSPLTKPTNFMHFMIFKNSNKYIYNALMLAISAQQNYLQP